MDKKILAFLLVLVISVSLIASFSVAKKGGTPGKPDRAKPVCNDNIDNDGDSYIDWPNDPGCSKKNDQSELDSAVECDDGTDNDGDGDVDYNDGGCTGPTDNDETNCGDGVCEGGETPESCPEDCGVPDSCSDTDGGIVLEVQGTVSGYDSSSPYSYDDYCDSATVLAEYSCLGDQWKQDTYDCTYYNATSCTNGACV